MSEICLSVFCTQHSFSRTRGKMVVQAGRRDSNDWRSFSTGFLAQPASAGRRRRQGWPGCSTVGSDGSSAGFFLLRGVRLPFLPGGGGGGFIGRPVGGGGLNAGLRPVADCTRPSNSKWVPRALAQPPLTALPRPPRWLDRELQPLQPSARFCTPFPEPLPHPINIPTLHLWDPPLRSHKYNVWVFME